MTVDDPYLDEESDHVRRDEDLHDLLWRDYDVFAHSEILCKTTEEYVDSRDEGTGLRSLDVSMQRTFKAWQARTLRTTKRYSGM